MAGKRYKHPDTLQDRRPQRVKPPLDLISPGGDLLGDDLKPVPPAPAGLLGKTRGYWTELHRGPMAKVILATDGFPLHRYIWNVDQWLRTIADLGAMRREFVPTGAAKKRNGMPSLMAQLEELQEAQAQGLIDDEEATSARKLLMEAWSSATSGRPPVVAFYESTWRLRQVLRQLEGDLYRAEQAYGLNPLARMRLNIAATEAVSGLDKLNRLLGERDERAEPEYVEPD